MMIQQSYEYTKNHWILHLKREDSNSLWILSPLEVKIIYKDNCQGDGSKKNHQLQGTEGTPVLWGLLEAENEGGFLSSTFLGNVLKRMSHGSQI